MDQVARIYTPLVVSTALLATTLACAFLPPAQAQQIVYQALVLLVVACPCALVISTPITYVCALASAASKGILIKGGVHLETLAGTQFTCFTGTTGQILYALSGAALASAASTAVLIKGSRAACI